MRWQPSFVQRRQAIESLLQRTHEQWVNGDDEALTALVNKSFFTIDVLLSLLFHEDMSIRLCALNLYIRRAYQTLSVQDVQLLDDMVWQQHQSLSSSHTRWDCCKMICRLHS